jgi:hypothetical protein
MEKGNAVESAVGAVPVHAIEGAGDRLMAVTTAVVDVTADTAGTLRDKVIDKVADAAIDEVERRRESPPGKGNSALDERWSQRPEND